MTWPAVPLGSVADVQLGKMLSPKAKTGTTAFPYLRNVNVQWGHINISDLVEMDFDEREQEKFSLRQGDLVVCEGGEPGRCAVVDRDLTGVYFQKALMRVRPRNGRIDTRFLQRFMGFAAQRGTFTRDGNQATIAHYPAVKLNALEVPVPPLAEQRRIADILDKADAIRRKRKAAMALTEELLRSAFIEMFGDPVTNPKGWPTAAIQDLASSNRNALAIGPFGSNLLAADYTESGHPVVFVRDLVTERFVWKSDVFVSARKFEELAAHHAAPGDVLATKMGTPPGIACVVPKGFPRAVVTADVVKVSVDRKKVFPDYLAAAINSSWGRHQIAGITAGVTRAKITLRDFRNVQVRLPDFEQQRRYVNYVAKIACASEGQKAAMSHAEDLFDSLVARAFSGGLSA